MDGFGTAGRGRMTCSMFSIPHSPHDESESRGRMRSPILSVRCGTRVILTSMPPCAGSHAMATMSDELSISRSERRKPHARSSASAALAIKTANPKPLTSRATGTSPATARCLTALCPRWSHSTKETVRQGRLSVNERPATVLDD